LALDPGLEFTSNFPLSDLLNAKLRGWHNYFRHGTVARLSRIVSRYVEKRVRHFLRRRHIETRSGGARRFPLEMFFGPLGVYRLERD